MVQCFYLTPSGFEFVKELHFLNLEKPPVSDAMRESDFTTWLSTLHAALNLDILKRIKNDLLANCEFLES